MTVGQPGYGLSGIFYLVSALSMPIQELALTVSGKSSKKRWQLVGKEFLLAVTCTAAVLLAGGGLHWITTPR